MNETDEQQNVNDPTAEGQADTSSVTEENDAVRDDMLEIPDVETEVALMKDQLLRALAEAENVRRRAARDKEDALKYSISSFARDLLAVADNLQRALETLSDDKTEELSSEVKSFLEGVIMTEKELLNVFEKHGIKKITPLGEKFDHGFHQAMLEMESNEHPAGTVVQLMQAGYILNDRLLRPALVGVAKASEDKEEQVEDN